MDNSIALPERSDVVIIGGGIMGTSIAYYLATESDRSVTLLEKNHIASGSTGDSSAVLRFNYGDRRIYTEMSLWSHEIYQNFEEITDNPLAYVECPRVRFGIEGTEEGEFIQQGYEILTSLGIPCERYEAAELDDRFPMFNDLDRFDFAIEDTAAAYTDGTDAANGFAKASRQAGANVLTGIEVTGFDVDRGSIEGVVTDEGVVECDAVIVAAGPWTPRLGRQLEVDIPIIPSKEEVAVLDPPAAFADRYLDDLPITRFWGGEMYVRPDFGGGVLAATHPYPDEPSDPDHYEDQPSEEMMLRFSELLEKEIPGLVESDIVGQYCGLYSTTPDHDFIIDQIGPAGTYFVCGFSGHGFKHAPAVGKMTRDLIVEGGTDVADLSYFSFDRFRETSEGRGRPIDPL